MLFVLPVSLLGLSATASAQGFVPLATIPGLTDQSPTEGGLATFFNNLYKYLIGLAATLAVLQIIWSGIEIALNRDDVSKIKDDKSRIYGAIAGLALVLSPALVFSIINPNILDLSVGLAPIDLTIRSATPPSQQPGSTNTNTSGAYANANSIPSGNWCFSQGGSFVCTSDQPSCESSLAVARSAQSTGLSDTCTQY